MDNNDIKPVDGDDAKVSQEIKGSHTDHDDVPEGDQDQVISNIDLECVKHIVPSYLYGAIRRTYSTPGVGLGSMKLVIPRTAPNSECQTTIEVTANKVEYLARALFDVNIETINGERHICLKQDGEGQGAEIVPTPNLLLKGARLAPAAEILGDMLYTGIQASGIFQSELKNVYGLRTDAVSMLISCNEASSGFLYLALAGPAAATLKEVFLHQGPDSPINLPEGEGSGMGAGAYI